MAAEYTEAGYSRGDWEHRSGHLCDAAGTDPYTAAPFTLDTCDVDHIVSAKEAFESGGWQWSVERRREFGRDPRNLTPSRDCVNRSKGAGDIAEWSGRVGSGACAGLTMTPAGRCFFAQRTTAVKAKWGLTADPAEADTLARCDG